MTPTPPPIPAIDKIKVKDDKLDATFKEASGPINFTMLLNVFGEKLSGEYQASFRSAKHSVCTYLTPNVCTSHIKPRFADLLKISRTWHSGTHIWGPCQHPAQANLSSIGWWGPLSFTEKSPTSGPGRTSTKNSTLGWELRVSQVLRVGRPLRASSGRGCGALGGEGAGLAPETPKVQGLLWAGMDPKETVLSAFKMLDPAGKGSANKDS